MICTAVLLLMMMMLPAVALIVSAAITLLLLLLPGAWMEHVVDPMLAVKDELLDTFRR
jgi:hypothetical protein